MFSQLVLGLGILNCDFTYVTFMCLTFVVTDVRKSQFTNDYFCFTHN